MEYKKLFGKLWVDYNNLNPSINKIHSLLEQEGEVIINDHIAFRTFDIPGINIDNLSSVFTEAGYIEKGKYFFADKRLNAKHFEHKADDMAPKVFISELITNDFSKNVRDAASIVARTIKEKNISKEELILSKNCWSPVSYHFYEALRKESEYAAWLYVFGFRANHFTIFINFLKKYTSIEKLNNFLKSSGFKLNEAGGEIKGTVKDLLKQSSTLADSIDVEFIEGVYKIPCCYYEFAERFKDSNGHIFNGFLEKSADKIFESTNKR
jgi:hypothetical protein